MLMKLPSRQSRHAGVEGELGAAEHDVGSSGDARVETFGGAVVEREHVVLHRFGVEQLLQELELLGVLRGHVVGEAEVLASVVQLPLVVGVVVGALVGVLPGDHVHHRGEPAVVVDAAVADALVVLRDVTVSGVAVVERVAHADTRPSGVCATPLTILGSGMPTASRIVGTMSITWCTGGGSRPWLSMPFGQCTTSGAMLPPPWAIVIAHVHGVAPANAQPTA